MQKQDVKPRSGGRPSRAEASQIAEHILGVATDLIFTNGYGNTSIEAIASACGISKRTFYHRFADKSELFASVVHRLIESLRPSDETRLFKGKTLEAILQQLATIILNAALSPQALALHRVMMAEATRFPELAIVMHKEGARSEAIHRISLLLDHEKKARHIALPDTRFAAEQFLHMVIDAPQQRALGLGTPMNKDELNRWINDTVTLFLHGCNIT